MLFAFAAWILLSGSVFYGNIYSIYRSGTGSVFYGNIYSIYRSGTGSVLGSICISIYPISKIFRIAIFSVKRFQI